MTSGKILSGPGRPVIPPRPDIKARLLDSTSHDPEAPRNRSNELCEITKQCTSDDGDKDARELAWTPACSGEAYFSMQDWLAVMSQLIRHPEHSSTDIRRADILCEEGSFAEAAIQGDKQAGPHRQIAHVRRELKPRRPSLDAALPQDCYLVQSSASGATYVLYIPLDGDRRPVTAAEQVPYYHPSVRAIAFAYVPKRLENGTKPQSTNGEEATRASAAIEVHVAPFEAGYDAVKQPQHRLSRTALRLVTLQTKLAWGEKHGYQKRVEHDRIIKREDYMDLYQELRQKHASRLISQWVEATDPEKHVFEDIGIATFLILLWKDMFPAATNGKCQEVQLCSLLSAARHWGRPSNFVDVGCGNGLLVHLLNAEGYTGCGVDIRARKTWKVVQELEGGADLREASLSAPALVSNASERPWPAGSFLIGNHADELTCWLPLISAADEVCPGFINIPCCRFLLNGVVSNHVKQRLGTDEMAEVRRLVPDDDLERTLGELQRGPATESTDSASRNVAYLRYISHLHLLAGWALEKEALRIPSTKNWCLVGRRRAFAKDENREKREQSLRESRERILELAQSEGAGWQARVTIDARSARNH